MIPHGRGLNQQTIMIEPLRSFIVLCGQKDCMWEGHDVTSKFIVYLV